MTAFRRASGLGIVGSAVLLAALASLAGTRAARAADDLELPVAIAMQGFSAENPCDDAFCGGADVLAMGALPSALPPEDFSALARIPSRGPSVSSAAAMAALGVAMLTARVRRKGLWAARAAWRTSTGQTV